VGRTGVPEPVHKKDIIEGDADDPQSHDRESVLALDAERLPADDHHREEEQRREQEPRDRETEGIKIAERELYDGEIDAPDKSDE
jgi:hypothetical protein